MAKKEVELIFINSGTEDWQTLKLMLVQRPIKDVRVKPIKDVIERKGYFTHEPITINGKGKILDGQHRFTALDQLAEKGKYYKVSFLIANVTIDDIAMLAKPNLRKSWSMEDHLHRFCVMEKRDYLNFRTLKETYQFSVGVMLNIAHGSTLTRNSRYDFTEGKFKVKDWDIVRDRCEKIDKIHHYYEYAKNRNFVKALIKFFTCDQFDFNIFLSRVSSNRDLLYRTSTVEQYCYVIDKAYNHRTRESQRVDFRMHFRF